MLPAKPLGREGHVVPQQWLAPHDLSGKLGGAIRCDAALASSPYDGAHSGDGAVLQVAERCKQATYPELAQGGAQSFARSGAAGTHVRCHSCGALSHCAPAEPRQPCAASPVLPARGAGDEVMVLASPNCHVSPCCNIIRRNEGCIINIHIRNQ